ncbi:hypothetical protein EDC01DRAFT_630645 [Geopyxis carbonaria]|nr:hypothetical protein EDC01DRAFT_630645 [Geopyxis carbonaria]
MCDADPLMWDGPSTEYCVAELEKLFNDIEFVPLADVQGDDQELVNGPVDDPHGDDPNCDDPQCDDQAYADEACQDDEYDGEAYQDGEYDDGDYEDGEYENDENTDEGTYVAEKDPSQFIDLTNVGASEFNDYEEFASKFRTDGVTEETLLEYWDDLQMTGGADELLAAQANQEKAEKDPSQFIDLTNVGASEFKDYEEFAAKFRMPGVTEEVVREYWDDLQMTGGADELLAAQAIQENCFVQQDQPELANLSNQDIVPDVVDCDYMQPQVHCDEFGFPIDGNCQYLPDQHVSQTDNCQEAQNTEFSQNSQHNQFNQGQEQSQFQQDAGYTQQLKETGNGLQNSAPEYNMDPEASMEYEMMSPDQEPTNHQHTGVQEFDQDPVSQADQQMELSTPTLQIADSQFPAGYEGAFQITPSMEFYHGDTPSGNNASQIVWSTQDLHDESAQGDMTNESLLVQGVPQHEDEAPTLRSQERSGRKRQRKRDVEEVAALPDISQVTNFTRLRNPDRSHRDASKVRGNFNCEHPGCLRSYERIGELRIHVKTHETVGPTCPLCVGVPAKVAKIWTIGYRFKDFTRHLTYVHQGCDRKDPELQRRMLMLMKQPSVDEWARHESCYDRSLEKLSNGKIGRGNRSRKPWLFKAAGLLPDKRTREPLCPEASLESLMRDPTIKKTSNQDDPDAPDLHGNDPEAEDYSQDVQGGEEEPEKPSKPATRKRKLGLKDMNLPDVDLPINEKPIKRRCVRKARQPLSG